VAGRARKQVIAATQDIRTGPEGFRRISNRGNQYTNFQGQVDTAWRMFKMQEQFGGLILRTILAHQVGTLCGNGASIRADRKKEQDFIDTFLKVNTLDGPFLTKIVRGGELEGQVLLVPKKHRYKGADTVKLQYLRWHDWRYRIYLNKDNFTEIERIEFFVRGAQSAVPLLDKNGFIYVSLEDIGSAGTHEALAEYPTPPIAPVLTSCASIEIAFADWRAMNSLWGTLGRHFEASDADTAAQIIEWLTAKQAAGGIEPGEEIAAAAKAYFPEPTGNGQQSIEREITALSRAISGYTGIGIHLLGYASEMSNRSTAEELREAKAVQNATRDLWVAAIYEILEKSMAMVDPTLDISRVDVQLAQNTSHQLKELVEVWLPLYDGGMIPKSMVQDRIPGWDPRMSKELEAQEAERKAQIQAQVDAMMNRPQEEPQEQEEDGNDTN
jgi:hypothetical protein